MLFGYRCRTLLRAGPSALLGLSLWASPAVAIPSPEIIVGSISSISQLGAMLAAMFGGGAALTAFRRFGDRQQSGPLLRFGIVGLLVAATLLAILNVYQWQSARSERHAYLAATLSRPSRLPGQKSNDPTLKELSAAEQAVHPLGISTAEAQRIVSNPAEAGYVILDIRETPEVEMGTFAGAIAVRYPDLMSKGADLQGRKALLICHNGNRSSESCQALAARGIDCRFKIGGLERWITEGRSAGGFHRSSLSQVRALPVYPNNERLIDTPEAKSLIERDRAVVVDVRYPRDFAVGHLPGAINLPMRRMPTPDLEAAIAGLPAGPVLVPCYERRSCFFGEVLGLALTRAGRDFRGRYTLPWEYVPTIKPPPHIAAMLAEREMSTYARTVRWLANFLAKAAETWGFVWVLFGLALASRLLILPFAIKSDRDQIVASRIEPEVVRLKQALADDPARCARALRDLYRANGMTPVLNLVALLGLPILAMAAGAVAQSAAIVGYELPIVGPLQAPDRTFLLPALFAAGIGAYAEWALVKSSRQRLFVWLVVAPAMLAAMAFVPAAVSLYANLSLALIMLQRLVVLWVFKRGERGKATRQPSPSVLRQGIVGLAEASAIPGIGGKAARLAELIGMGVPVPQGAVLTPGFLYDWQAATPKSRRRLVARLARIAGRGPYAVRSSAQGEDGAGASHAGVFETVTDVARPGLADAIDRVLHSYASQRAASYAEGNLAGKGGIVVQRMITARFSGVLFTRAPDASGVALVELVEGAGETLVSGYATPMSFRFGRASSAPMADQHPPIDLAPLLALGRRIEAHFGWPQDIEWVYADGCFSIVQSRDITTSVVGLSQVAAEEWERLLVGLAGGSREPPILIRNELAEMLPTPTPVSLSLIEALHGPGGSVDLACRRLGIGYAAKEGQHLFWLAFGRLYLDQREAASRAPRLARWQNRRLVRSADALEQHVRMEVLPAMGERSTRLAAMDFTRLDLPHLVRLIREMRDEFVTQSHVEAEIVNILADMCVSEARSGLEALGIDAAPHLVPTGETQLEAGIRSAEAMAPTERAARLAAVMGHRAHLDYELAEPRFGEQPVMPDVATPVHKSVPGVELAALSSRLATSQLESIERARRMQTLKEDAKHVVLAEVAVLRQALLALDQRLGLGGAVFHLSLDEICKADRASGELRAVATQRAAMRAELLEQPALPARVTLETVEASSWRRNAEGRSAVDGMAGTRVAGAREVESAAFVVDQKTAEAGRPLVDFEDGQILVTPFVHPAWLGVVLRAGGVVTEIGGWLSHMAIVARERDVAMIVGVEGWRHISPGERLRLRLDGSIHRQPAS